MLFVAALGAHFHFATKNWRCRFMPGHEFRQTQTALIAHYIDKENNFSVDYSVPLLGKPWVLPLEFPLYEWSIVGLSRATHLPHHQAARLISLTCFYLTLPALYLLLGQLRLPRPQRLFVLACILLCPVYLFYSRAVLIDPMALLFSAWFLAAFARMLRDRRWGWLLLCSLCGCAAGVIKSLVWFVWVVPAMAYGGWRLWRDWRDGGAQPALRTLAWGLGSVVLPFTTAIWWARYTDAIKAAHPSAHIFTAANLAVGNYGTFSLSARLDPDTWRNLLTCWHQSLLPAWALALVIVPGLVFLPRWRRRIAAAAALFLAAQLLLPLAYAYQDYYFYAANAFAAAAIAFVFLGLLDSRLPRPFAAVLLLIPLAALLANYRAGYFNDQAVPSNGGSGLTESLQAYTPPDSVLVIAGNDWCPSIPFYAERKALMLRSGLESDENYLQRAFADLHDEEVGALILVGSQRANSALVAKAAAAFNLDPAPTYRHTTADVYLAKPYREEALRALQQPAFDQITAAAAPASVPVAAAADQVSPTQARTTFSMVSPAPTRARSTFPYGVLDHGGARLLSAHPDSNLWIPPPPQARRIECAFGILPGAYEGDDGATNGVEFIVDAERADGTVRPLFRRVLTPAETASDRGVQTASIAFEPGAGETLVFRTRPNGHPAFDWAFWQRIEIK